MSKLGSFISGLMDAFATATSIMLQYGVPLEVMVNKFAFTKFDPQGVTKNKQIRFAKSVLDYIFRYLAIKFLNKKDFISGGNANADYDTKVIDDAKSLVNNGDTTHDIPFEGIHRVETQKFDNDDKTYTKNLYGDADTRIFNEENGNRKRQEFIADKQLDAPPCSVCGETMVRNGSCYKCMNCGATSGCS